MATSKDTPKKKPAPKTVEKKAVTPKAVAPKKVTAAKKAMPKKASDKKLTKKTSNMSGFERYKMIEVAAYYIAEKNGFAGHAADYWVAAEKEIDKKSAKK